MQSRRVQGGKNFLYQLQYYDIVVLFILIIIVAVIFQIQSLKILRKMSQNYGVQCSLCDLDAVKPLVSILLFENKVSIRSLAAATLQNISKLRKGRKLIRLNEGVRILVRTKNI